MYICIYNAENLRTAEDYYGLCGRDPARGCGAPGRLQHRRGEVQLAGHPGDPGGGSATASCTVFLTFYVRLFLPLLYSGMTYVCI